MSNKVAFDFVGFFGGGKRFIVCSDMEVFIQPTYS